MIFIVTFSFSARAMHAAFLTPIAAPIFVLPAQSQSTGGGFNFLFVILLFAGMWFLLLAPQRKKQKAHDKMVSELNTGDRILTNGGMFAEVVAVRDDRLVVKIAESTRVEIAKSAVQHRFDS